MRKLFYFIVCLFTILLFYSCTTTKYVEVPVETTKIAYKDRLQVDTIVRVDSVVVRDTPDTVYMEKYKYLYKTNIKLDTITKIDTIRITDTVVQEATTKSSGLKSWHVVLMCIGSACAGIALCKLIV